MAYGKIMGCFRKDNQAHKSEQAWLQAAPAHGCQENKLGCELGCPPLLEVLDSAKRASALEKFERYCTASLVKLGAFSL